MVTGFMCHEDADTALQRGLEGFQFFGYALAHYYITGTHVPGRFDVRADFRKKGNRIYAPTGGIGNVEQVRANLEKSEAMGVDQVIFIQQGATTATSTSASPSSCSRAASSRTSRRATTRTSGGRPSTSHPRSSVRWRRCRRSRRSTRYRRSTRTR
jgi:hypothetical protein